MTMGHSKRGGRGKNPPSSPSVTYINGILIKSNVVPSPSVTSIIDGFPIRAMPHLAAVAEVGSPNAPPDLEGHKDSEVPIRAMSHLAADAEVGSPMHHQIQKVTKTQGVPIRAMPHLAADAEVGSPDAPPDPEGHKDSEVPIRGMPHLAADAEVGSPNAQPDPEGHKRGGSWILIVSNPPPIRHRCSHQK